MFVMFLILHCELCIFVVLDCKFKNVHAKKYNKDLAQQTCRTQRFTRINSSKYGNVLPIYDQNRFFCCVKLAKQG